MYFNSPLKNFWYFTGYLLDINLFIYYFRYWKLELRISSILWPPTPIFWVLTDIWIVPLQIHVLEWSLSPRYMNSFPQCIRYTFPVPGLLRSTMMMITTTDGPTDEADLWIALILIEFLHFHIPSMEDQQSTPPPPFVFHMHSLPIHV